MGDCQVASAGTGYLQLQGRNWTHCLGSSLAFLRQSWGGDWVGLPYVLTACANFLKLKADALPQPGVAMLAAARDVALQIEREGGRCPGSDEPAYHNRLHFSDALTAMTLQLAIESERWNLQHGEWHAAMLLMSVAHDFQHPGKVNSHLQEIESRSFAALQPFLQRHVVPAVWQQRIEDGILRTDFSMAKENHRRVSGLAFSWCSDWAAVLLNESDVMASADSLFGPPLGQALAQEWERISFPAHLHVATAQGRVHFLQSIAFSSYSSHVLGAPEKVQRQLGKTQLPA